MSKFRPSYFDYIKFNRVYYTPVVENVFDLIYRSRFEAVKSVADAAFELGLGVKGVVASSLPGPSGNVEYFLWLEAGAPALDEQILLNAIARGPQ